MDSPRDLGLGANWQAEIAEQDGQEAYVAGEAVSANPFNPGTPNHTAWLRGWHDAERRNVR